MSRLVMIFFHVIVGGLLKLNGETLDILPKRPVLTLKPKILEIIMAAAISSSVMVPTAKVEQKTPETAPKIAQTAQIKPHVLSAVSYIKHAPKPIIRHISVVTEGNLYTPGYCTWYVKNKRPDLPNSLGNAYSWYSRAASLGLSVGSIPKPGAAGQFGNHVVYVESVSGGLMHISEMNERGLYVVSERTIPWFGWRFIY